MASMTFADVTNAKKKTNTNFESRIPNTRVSSVPIEIPSLEDFPPLPSLPKKKNISNTIVHTEEVLRKMGAVLVSGQAPVPIVPSVNEPPATRSQFEANEGPSKPEKQSKKGGHFTLA